MRTLDKTTGLEQDESTTISWGSFRRNVMCGNNNDTGDPDSGYPSSIPTYSEVQDVVDVAV